MIFATTAEPPWPAPTALSSKHDSHCYHCGLAIAGSPQIFSLIEQQQQPMCCVACKAVCEAIRQHGFANYYQYRSAPGQRPDTETIDYQQYDKPALQASFTTRLDSSYQRSTIIIEGIHCAACVWLLEHSLASIDGVIRATVNFSDHTASIDWDNTITRLSTLFLAIHDIGYLPHPYSPDQRQRLYQREHNQALRRLGVAGIGMMQVGMFAIALYAGDFQSISDQYKQLLRVFSLLVASAVLLYCGRVFFQGALRSLKNRSLNMDVPVAIALSGAYIGSVWGTWYPAYEVYFDSIVMFIFFLLLARYLEMRSRNRVLPGSQQRLLPQTCKRLQGEHRPRSFELLPLEDIQPGDQILVQAGETLPADGRVLEGSSSVDESAFTGEFLPVGKQAGDAVMAGTINGDGSLVVEVRAIGHQSSLSVVQALLSRAQSEKPRIAQLADRTAQYFIAVVLFATLLTGLYWSFTNAAIAFPVMLAMLVVSCPCALSLATPTALTLSNHVMRNAGLLASKSHVLEQASRIEHVIFDKTGTLTRGELSITRTECFTGTDATGCKAIAAALEGVSQHPIAKAFCQQQANTLASNTEIITGSGIEGELDAVRYRIGSLNFCQQFCAQSAPVAANSGQQLTVWLCHEQQWLACFSLHDEIRASAAEMVRTFLDSGYQVSILSGDSSAAVDTVAAQLGISEFSKGLSPAQKLAAIGELKSRGQQVMMVGDGINDMPVLAAATISVAMNNASDLTRVQADALLLSDSLQPLSLLMSQSAKTRRIIRENISWALSYNAIALPLAACGFIPPYLAAVGMSASSLLVILNTLRLSRPHTQDTR